MIEGKIMKYYRDKLGMTQNELGKDICSITHLSQIERGLPIFSADVLDALSERLGIDLNMERERYNQTKIQLHKWHDSLVMQDTDNIYRLKRIIEQDGIINTPNHYYLYKLLLARFYLSIREHKKCLKIISNLKKHHYQNLTAKETNLLTHVYGMYYFNKKQLKQCITILESIDLNQYHNVEYFYYLALAHHCLLSNTKAYYFASKALDFFHRTYNVSRIIDTEMFMLIQLNAATPHNFDYTKKKYDELIQMCETCHDLKRKSKLLHNLAFEYKRRGYLQEAYHHYLKAFKYIEEGDPLYISILDGYIDACIKGNMLAPGKLLNLCQRG